MSGKIFGIGLSKTGTTSLNEALNLLGIKSIHYPPANDFILGNYQPNWLTSYDAATDVPIPYWYKHLDKAYPGSKFILTIRDKTSWAKSMRSWTGSPNVTSQQSCFMRWLLFGDVRFNTNYIVRYEQHNCSVIDYFHDRNDLLVMNIIAGDSWEKLCPFLGGNIPNIPFPSIRPSHKITLN